MQKADTRTLFFYHSHVMGTFYLIGLEALSLHAVLPEGQDAVLKAH